LYIYSSKNNSPAVRQNKQAGIITAVAEKVASTITIYPRFQNKLEFRLLEVE
jgi:hypothetical protein